jgi:DNA-binding response OmpR family regulator
MRKPTILVADDDRHVRAAIRRRLVAMGYGVMECGDGLGVLRSCADGQVDAVILDHGMPNGDGRSVARIIRNESDVPIIFVSGFGRSEFRAIVHELPDVYYLGKPFDECRLASLLDSVLGGARGVSAAS